MGQLLLLRHAKAVPQQPNAADHSRPLTEAGRAAARRVRDAMSGMGVAADLVLVSSARRTLQTLQQLSPWISPQRVEVMDQLYLAPMAAMLHVLRQVTPVMESVLLIGHNPGLHELALTLCDGTTPEDAACLLRRQFPPAALAAFGTAGEWSALGPGTGRLRRLIVAG